MAVELHLGIAAEPFQHLMHRGVGEEVLGIDHGPVVIEHRGKDRETGSVGFHGVAETFVALPGLFHRCDTLGRQVQRVQHQLEAVDVGEAGVTGAVKGHHGDAMGNRDHPRRRHHERTDTGTLKRGLLGGGQPRGLQRFSHIGFAFERWEVAGSDFAEHFHNIGRKCIAVVMDVVAGFGAAKEGCALSFKQCPGCVFSDHEKLATGLHGEQAPVQPGHDFRRARLQVQPALTLYEGTDVAHHGLRGRVAAMDHRGGDHLYRNDCPVTPLQIDPQRARSIARITIGGRHQLLLRIGIEDIEDPGANHVDAGRYPGHIQRRLVGIDNATILVQDDTVGGELDQLLVPGFRIFRGTWAGMRSTVAVGFSQGGGGIRAVGPPAVKNRH